MSYCRWSSDDYQCDVYVYESDRGFETHVAARRRVFKVPLPPPEPFTIENVVAWHARYKAVLALMDDEASCEWVNLPEAVAGESFTDATAGECADRLERLRDEYGLNVPQYAVDSLREEQAAVDA